MDWRLRTRLAETTVTVLYVALDEWLDRDDARLLSDLVVEHLTYCGRYSSAPSNLRGLIGLNEWLNCRRPQHPLRPTVKHRYPLTPLEDHTRLDTTAALWIRGSERIRGTVRLSTNESVDEIVHMEGRS